MSSLKKDFILSYEDNITTNNKYNLFSKSITLIYRTLNHKAIITLMDQGFVSAANFLTGVIVGKACTKEQFGLYMLGLTLFMFATGIQSSIILTPFTIYSPRLRGLDYDLYLKNTFIHQVVFSILTMAFLAFMILTISLGIGPVNLLPILQVLIAVISFMLMREYARCVCFAAMKAQHALLVDILVSTLQVCGLLLLVRFNALSPSMAYWIIGLACAAGAGVWLISERKALTIHLSRTVSHFRYNWSVGKWLLASTIVWSLSTYLYPWALTSFHGTAATGVWAACQGVVTIFNPVIGGLQNYLGPKMAHTYSEGGMTALRRFSLLAAASLTMLMAPFCLTLLFFGDLILSLLYGDKYEGNGFTAFIFAIGLLFSVITFCFSRTFFVLERADLDFKINFFSLFVLFSLGLWLTRSFSVMGAAVGIVLGNLGGLIARYVLFYKIVRS